MGRETEAYGSLIEVTCDLETLAMLHTNVACSRCASVLFAVVLLETLEEAQDADTLLQSFSKCSQNPSTMYLGTCLAGHLGRLEASS